MKRAMVFWCLLVVILFLGSGMFADRRSLDRAIDRVVRDLYLAYEMEDETAWPANNLQEYKKVKPISKKYEARVKKRYKRERYRPKEKQLVKYIIKPSPPRLKLAVRVSKNIKKKKIKSRYYRLLHRIVEIAKSRVGFPPKRRKRHIYKWFLNDCAGFVWSTYYKAGITDLWDKVISLSNRVNRHITQLKGVGLTFEVCKRYYKLFKTKYPLPSDIIFFDNTWDRNRNRRLDDYLTHVGLVVSVSSNGTIEFIHGGTSKGVVRGFMNLLHPHRHRLNGKVINSFIRAKYRHEKGKRVPKLAGELFRCFGRVLKP